MSELPPFPDELRAEIESLSAALDPLLTRRPHRTLPPQLDRRRHALLERVCGPRPVPTETITCVGDSNIMVFAGAEYLRFIRYRHIGIFRHRWVNRGLDLLPCFRVFHLGPATAWNSAQPGSSTRALEKLDLVLRKDVPPGGKVLLSYGEIDCRVHMPRALAKGKSLAEAVDATARRCLRAYQHVRDRGFRPYVWAPPLIIPNDKAAFEGLDDFSPWSLRKEITHAYDARLRELCAQESLPFAVLGESAKSDTEDDPALQIDLIHLSQRMMPAILDELWRAGLWESA